MCVLSHICDPMNYIAFQAPLSMESSTEGYWSGLSFTTPGDLPNPGVKPMSFSISCIGSHSLNPELFAYEAKLDRILLLTLKEKMIYKRSVE